MICPNCGKEVTEGAKFCFHCGEKLAEETVPTPTDSVPTPTDSVPTPTESVPTIAESVPTPTDSVPTPTDSVPTIAESAPAAATAVMDKPEVANTTDEAVKGEKVKPVKGGLKNKIIAAAVAAVVVIGGGVVGLNFAFARNNLFHAFMGNRKYAASLAKTQLEQLGELSLSAPGESSSENDNLTSVAAALKSAVPENGAEFDLNAEIELSDDMLSDAANEINGDEETASAILDALKDVHAGGSIKFSDNGIGLGAYAKEGDGDLGKVQLYYDGETEAYYLAVPDASDKSVKFSDESLVINMDDLNADSDDNAFVQLLTDIGEAYYDNLKNAEFSYEKQEISIGDVAFNGKVMSVTFSDDVLAGLLSDVADAVEDSDYGSLLSGLNVSDAVESLEDGDINADLTIEHMVNGDNSIAGTRVDFSAKSDYGKSSFTMVYINNKSGLALSVKADGDEIVKVTQEKESKNAGKYVITISDGGEKNKVTVKYEWTSKMKFFGNDIQLGTYNISFSGNDLEELDGQKAEIELSEDDGALLCKAKADVEGVKVTANIRLAEGTSEEVTADSAKVANAFDFEEDVDSYIDFQEEVLTYLEDKWSNSKLIDAISSGRDESVLDEMRAELNRMNRDRLLVKNYKDYDENTVSRARSFASDIYSSLRYDLSSAAISKKGEFVIKGYFDSNGSFKILDNAGEADAARIIEEQLSSYNSCKNAYVEFVMWYGRGPLCGVSVTMTDDSSNIPDNLPNAYNFLDKEYNFGSDEDVNYIGAFVVGTSPRLANGEGGKTAENDKQTAENVKAYNDYAEKAYTAFGKIMNDNGITFRNDYDSYIYFKVSNKNWNYYTGTYKPFDGDIDSSDLCDAMKAAFPDFDNGYIYIYYNNKKIVGASVSDRDYRFYNSVFAYGYLPKWGYTEGVTPNGYTMGVYPKLPEITNKLSDSVISDLTGTWKRDSGSASTIEFNSDNLSKVKSVGYYSSDGLQIVLDDDTKIVYYFGRNYIYINGSSYKKD